MYLVGGEIRLTGGNTLEGVEVGLVPSDKSICESSQRFQTVETLFLDGTRDGGILENFGPSAVHDEERLPVSSCGK